jgi:hypothetical protein
MAANGIDVPVSVALSGSGVTQIAGSVYQVTLSLTGTTSVAVTAVTKDSAGDDPSYSGDYNWVSYNAAPTGAAGKVATVSAATGNPITVSAVSQGMAIVEAYVPAFDVDGSAAAGSGKVYALLQVQVNA